jgi:hypothetical protein
MLIQIISILYCKKKVRINKKVNQLIYKVVIQPELNYPLFPESFLQRKQHRDNLPEGIALTFLMPQQIASYHLHSHRW